MGPYFRVDHDLSLLVPEIWCRMRVHEREPAFLIEHGYLEKVPNFCVNGRVVQASRLGYRITSLFVDRILGRLFKTPDMVFPEELLRPEKQDLDQFAAGVDAIMEAQTHVALEYFEDGSVEAACPPLKALLHIMAHGSYAGRCVEDPEIRGLFTRHSMLASDWYRERLIACQNRETALWRRHIAALEQFQRNEDPAPEFAVEARLSEARAQLSRRSEPTYLEELKGTIGADPFHGQLRRQ